MKIYRFAGAVLVAGLSLLISGCGGGGDTEVAPPPESNSATTFDIHGVIQMEGPSGLRGQSSVDGEGGFCEQQVGGPGGEIVGFEEHEVRLAVRDAEDKIVGLAKLLDEYVYTEMDDWRECSRAFIVEGVPDESEFFTFEMTGSGIVGTVTRERLETPVTVTWWRS